MSQDLIPKLQTESIIVMDNVTLHKNKLLQNEIKEAGHILLYLPPYSPDLNPIEQKWARAKPRRKKHFCDIGVLF